MRPETPANREPASEEGGDDATGASGGVFGNLPQTRPGARSPRRERSGNGGPRRAKAPRAEPKPRQTRAAKPRSRPAQPGARAPKVEPPRTPEPQAQESSERSGGGIEDVAWAGVAAAAEAATIGVRLATRALEAMRDATGRR